MKKEVTIKQYKAGNFSSKVDVIAEESEIQLNLNNREELYVSMSPSELNAFAHGFLLTSGLVHALKDIEEIKVGHHQIDIQLKQLKEKRRMMRFSGCGSGNTLQCDIDKKAMDKVMLPDFDILPLLYKEFSQYSEVFKQTGGIHSAAIIDNKNILYFSEDIGRHNAVDKVVGKAFMAGIEMKEKFLLTSGRISSEIVKKVFLADLRAIVSRAAPTCAAVKLARQLNIGLIGFLRGKRFNIY